MSDRDISFKCGGRCCRDFYLPFTYDELQEKAAAGQFQDGEQIAAMVRPIPGGVEGHQYRCTNLGNDGLCTIYADRPRMCREFPYGGPCPNEGCAFNSRGAAAK